MPNRLTRPRRYTTTLSLLALVSLLLSNPAFSFESKLVDQFAIENTKSLSGSDDESILLSITVENSDYLLELVPSALINEVLIVDDTGADVSITAYEGSVVGFESSWARVTLSGDHIFGMVDIGDQHFEFTSEGALQGKSAPDTSSLIDKIKRSVKSNEVGSVNALRTGKLFSRVLSIGIVVDHLYNNQRFGNGLAHAISVISGVDGIFRQELDLAIKLEVAVLSHDAEFSFFPGASPSQLSKFREFRHSTPELQSEALTLVHLFTGSVPPSGSTGVGFSYIGSICSANDYDISVSASYYRDTELAAHEIAHNLGALHDTETASCASQTDRLMNPVINGASRFSSCSLDRIKATLRDTGCYTEVHDGSVSLSKHGNNGVNLRVASASTYNTFFNSEVVIFHNSKIKSAPHYCRDESTDTLICHLPLQQQGNQFDFQLTLDVAAIPAGGATVVAEYILEDVFEKNPSNNVSEFHIPFPQQVSGAPCVDSDGDGYGWNGVTTCYVSSNTIAIPNTVPAFTNLQTNSAVQLQNLPWRPADIVNKQIECRTHFWDSTQRQYLPDNSSYYRYNHALTPGQSSSGSTNIAYFVRGSQQGVTGTDLDNADWIIGNDRYSGPAPFSRSGYLQVIDTAGGTRNAVRSWSSNISFDQCTSFPNPVLAFIPTGLAGQGETGVCFDSPPTGDGWGWNGVTSCVIEAPVQVSAAGSKTVIVKSTSGSVTVDGRLDQNEWNSASRADSSGKSLTVPVAIAGLRTEREADRWQIMHDNQNIYIGLTVPDATPQKDSRLFINDDSVEIFIDGGNQKSNRYDTDDMRLIFRDTGELTGVFNPGASIGHIRKYDAVNKRYIYEIQIKKSTLQSYDGQFGFDVHVNNDQNGGDRDSKWSWSGERGENVQWFDPSSFGTACLDNGVLSGACQSSTVSAAGVCVDTGVIGDGWGWDGIQSCQISNCVDTGVQGDGWGWDGSQSCRIPL